MSMTETYGIHHMPDGNAITPQKAAVIPYRVIAESIEILLITSQRQQWIIPKGTIEPGMTAHGAARMEAYEEAGVLGMIACPPLGYYWHTKGNGKRHPVVVFSMLVDVVLAQWPEKQQRQRAWLPARQAAHLVGDDHLRGMILALATQDPAMHLPAYPHGIVLSHARNADISPACPRNDGLVSSSLSVAS